MRRGTTISLCEGRLHVTVSPIRAAAGWRRQRFWAWVADARPVGIQTDLSLLGNEFAHDSLLLLDKLVGVDDHEIELSAHRQVLFENAALKDAETLVRVGR